MNNGKDSKKLFGTRSKVICFAAIAVSAPTFLFMRYIQQGRLGWVDYVAAASALIMGTIVISVIAWHANRP